MIFQIERSYYRKHISSLILSIFFSKSSLEDSEIDSSLFFQKEKLEPFRKKFQLPNFFKIKFRKIIKNKVNLISMEFYSRDKKILNLIRDLQNF